MQQPDADAETGGELKDLDQIAVRLNANAGEAVRVRAAKAHHAIGREAGILIERALACEHCSVVTRAPPRARRKR